MILDEKYNITCPCGDTGLLLVSLLDVEDMPLEQSVNGAAVFAVCKPLYGSGSYETLNYLEVPVVDNTVTIDITYEFSSKLTPNRPGQSYLWDIRIVTNPQYDDNGRLLYPDNTSEVRSIFAGREGGMPKYTVPGVAVEVARQISEEVPVDG